MKTSKPLLIPSGEKHIEDSCSVLFYCLIEQEKEKHPISIIIASVNLLLTVVEAITAYCNSACSQFKQCCGTRYPTATTIKHWAVSGFHNFQM